MPRIQKTKEQIIADIQNNYKFQENMKFAKEKFFPALCKSSKSIDDATMFLASINNILMESFLGFMKEKTFGDLKLIDKLDNKDDKYMDTVALLELFNDKSVFDAKELLEGMRTEIQLFINEENKVRPLTDLKTKWLDDYVAEILPNEKENTQAPQK